MSKGFLLILLAYCLLSYSKIIIGASYNLNSMLILFRTYGFYLVSHMLYRFNLNDLLKFWNITTNCIDTPITKIFWYLNNDMSDSPNYVVILFRKYGFYLVFHMLGRCKLNGLAVFFNKRFFYILVETFRNTSVSNKLPQVFFVWDQGQNYFVLYG